VPIPVKSSKTDKRASDPANVTVVALVVVHRRPHAEAQDRTRAHEREREKYRVMAAASVLLGAPALSKAAHLFKLICVPARVVPASLSQPSWCA
jgi:hypothetical protein